MELKTHNKDLFTKLLPEVLGHIFVHCLPPESEPISLKSGPLLLVQVCHHWRRVAFGTPRLWQNIHMNRKWPENPIFILDLFLTKSGNLPLTIRLPFSHDSILERDEAVINRVLDDFHRVVSLEAFPDFIFKRLGIPHAPRHIYAPSLKHLDITDFKISREEDIKVVHNCIIAPNLDELHLNRSRVMLSMVSFSPESLRILTGLCITEVAKITDVSFLCETVNLETLQLSLYGWDEVQSFNFPSSVNLPNLKYLNVELFGHRYMEIIRPFHCPAIEKLSLSLSYYVLSELFVEVLTKGQIPPLRSLSLFGAPPNTEYAELSAFYKFREVEELILHSYRWNKITVQALIEKEGHQFRLFPRLSSITIGRADLNRKNRCASVITLLKTRCMTSGGTLAHATFQNCVFRASDKEDIQALQKALNGKLRIDIIGHGELPW